MIHVHGTYEFSLGTIPVRSIVDAAAAVAQSTFTHARASEIIGRQQTPSKGMNNCVPYLSPSRATPYHSALLQ